jgi:uncharacterized protein involved in outer membrane biogenesis
MIKWLFKWILRTILFLGIVAFLLIAFKDSIYSAITVHRIRARTGMDVQIGQFSSSLFSPTVTIRNLKLYNTAEFGGTLFLDVPELHVEVNPLSLAERKLRLSLVRFQLAELAIVRNESGQTNIVSLLNRAEHEAAKHEKGALEHLLGDLEFAGIDVLNLSLGKARFIDLKNASNNRETRVDLENQIFKNVNSEADVYGMLVVLWLRSGGKFSFSPNDLAQDYIGRQVQRPEPANR